MSRRKDSTQNEGRVGAPGEPEEPLELLRARIVGLLDTYLSRIAGADYHVIDPRAVAGAFQEVLARALSDPRHLLHSHAAYWTDMRTLFERTAQRLSGEEPVEAVIAPKSGDKRFAHERWSKDPLFDWLKQAYLLTAQHLEAGLGSVEGLDAATQRKVRFYVRQFVDALSPSNFPATNPEVLEAIGESNGESLVRGLDRLLQDLERQAGQLRPPMSEPTAFRVGETLAVTPGAVVFANELMQLIQYDPVTPTVRERPLLIVPPWINKYYVLDLRPANSFVRWAVERGHTVFVISWVNPGPEQGALDFADYMRDGPLAALDAIHAATGARDVNLLGYCIGGTLSAATVAHMAARGDERVRSVTLLATLLDFSDPGEIAVFIDEEQISRLEAHMQRHGYLDGRHMADAFAYLRDKELIWSFYVRGYLQGRPPPPFDLLFWSSDSTRMPAAMHSFYLRNMYQRNLLREPGGIVLDGVPIDLRRVAVPAYFLSTREDHIAPWRSTYAGARLFSGPVRFVLGGSGHVAGVINPPQTGKYGHWIGERLPEDPDAWLETATHVAGSWWSDWARWIEPHAGGDTAARWPGEGELPVIEPAPGSYVLGGSLG